METHPALKELYMGYNMIMDAGARVLVDAGGKSQTLSLLDLDCCGIKNTPKPSEGNIEAICDFFNE